MVYRADGTDVGICEPGGEKSNKCETSRPRGFGILGRSGDFSAPQSKSSKKCIWKGFVVFMPEIGHKINPIMVVAEVRHVVDCMILFVLDEFNNQDPLLKCY